MLVTRSRSPPLVEDSPDDGCPRRQPNCSTTQGGWGLAIVFVCCGLLLVVVPFMQWATWSGGPSVTVGAGQWALALAALGLAMTMMGYQALPHSTRWHFTGMVLASVVACVTAAVVAS